MHFIYINLAVKKIFSLIYVNTKMQQFQRVSKIIFSIIEIKESFDSLFN